MSTAQETWRERKRFGSAEGRRGGTPSLPHWVWLPENVTLSPMWTLSLEALPPSCNTFFPSQVYHSRIKKYRL